MQHAHLIDAVEVAAEVIGGFLSLQEASRLRLLAIREDRIQALLDGAYESSGEAERPQIHADAYRALRFLFLDEAPTSLALSALCLNLEEDELDEAVERASWLLAGLQLHRELRRGGRLDA